MIEKEPAYLQKLEIYPSYTCNRSCRFCFVSKHDKLKFAKPMTFHALCESIYRAYKSGTRTLSILGGEPTLYEKLPELLKFAYRLGYIPPILFSNGFKLADLSYAKLMQKLHIGAVQINLPSHEQKQFNFLTRTNGYFEKAVQAVKNLKEVNIPVIAVCVLTKQNYLKLRDYAAFYHGLGVDFFMVHYSKFLGNLDPNMPENIANISEIAVQMKDCVPSLCNMIDYCVQQRIVPPFVEIMPPCILGSYSSRIVDFIQTSGYAGSEAMVQPDIELSQSRDISCKGRIKFQACKKCIWNVHCFGVEKNYVDVFGDKEFKPVYTEPIPYYGNITSLEADYKTLLTKPLPELSVAVYVKMNGGSIDDYR